jgi:hypothetical protein
MPGRDLRALEMEDSGMKFSSGKLRVYMLMAIAWAGISGCAKPEELKYEPPLTPQTPSTESAEAKEEPDSRLPEPAEIREIASKIFRDAAVVDMSRTPHFVVGDFNGDRSTDLGVVLKPQRLAELNQEYAPWMLKDPLKPNDPQAQPKRIETNDSLFAVIHGFGPKGWRDPEATQVYLLRNVVGSKIKTQSPEQFIAVNRSRNMPKVWGDVIAEELEGVSGFLYYTGATYSWYDPRSFRPEADRRFVHVGASAK